LDIEGKDRGLNICRGVGYGRGGTYKR